MSKVRPLPCEACPYRVDVPSGVWAEHEYDKLVEYDAPTGEQPMAVFACHASPQALCHGWVMVHENRGHEYQLLALRIRPPQGPVPWVSQVQLFSSGAEAAAHGKRDIEDPSGEALRATARLMDKHPRLRGSQEEMPSGT